MPSHKEFADSLRKLADFYEEHTAIPLPLTGEVWEIPVYAATATNMPLFRSAFLRATGYAEKRYGDPFFRLVGKFGCIELHAVEYREKICVRRVVGTETKRVEKQVPIAYRTEISEEIIEQVEWDCKPLGEVKMEMSSTLTLESGPILDAIQETEKP